LTQTEAPVTPENLPITQFVQLVDDVAPSVLKNLPTSHFVHTDAWVTEENVPISQLLQTEAPEIPENLPSAQFIQLVDDVSPPVLKNLPTSHLVHTATTTCKHKQNTKQQAVILHPQTCQACCQAASRTSARGSWA
jgi:hypothetical protein